MSGRLWVVFGACLTQFTIIGMLFSYGIFLKVFETEFGWSRTLLSGCQTLAFFIMGLLAMVSRAAERQVRAASGPACHRHQLWSWLDAHVANKCALAAVPDLCHFARPRAWLA